jgi:hypothetical protein
MAIANLKTIRGTPRPWRRLPPVAEPRPTYGWVQRGRLLSRFVKAGAGSAKLITADAVTRSTGLPDRHGAAVCVALCGQTTESHDPAATTPDLTSASRRARSRQDRCAPLRGGLRPVLTQSPRGACNAHGPGRKAALQAEQKAILGLQTKGCRHQPTKGIDLDCD